MTGVWARLWMPRGPGGVGKCGDVAALRDTGRALLAQCRVGVAPASGVGGRANHLLHAPRSTPRGVVTSQVRWRVLDLLRCAAQLPIICLSSSPRSLPTIVLTSSTRLAARLQPPSSLPFNAKILPYPYTIPLSRRCFPHTSPSRRHPALPIFTGAYCTDKPSWYSTHLPTSPSWAVSEVSSS